MQEYNLPRPMPKIKYEDPFKKYDVTDEYIFECIDKIAEQLKGFNIDNNYAEYEDAVDKIIKKDFPKLFNFISGYGIGVFAFLSQFRNEIRKRLK